MAARIKESDIQSAICDYLALKRYFFWRQNSSGIYRDGHYFRLPRYSRRGVPDIILVHKGRFIGIEVKSHTGRLSPDQKEFQSEAERAGGLYIVARSVDDVILAGL